MLLTGDQILQYSDLKKEIVNVPEWKGEVYVREMAGWERDHWELRLVSAKGNPSAILENVRASLAVLTVCGEDSMPLFKLEDAIELGKKSAAALDRILEVAQRLNKISNDDVDGIVKNSNPGQSEDSGTD